MGEKGSRTTGLWITIGVLVVLLLGNGLLTLGMSVALFSGSSVEKDNHPVDEEPALSEVWSYGYGSTKVARIPLTGVILRGESDRLFGYEPDMVATILKQIRAATIDDKVKAILLEINSPGGAVTPSDEIYAALNHFKAEDEERIIIAFIRDLGASGAYYAAMASDYIIAEPTAIVGSVGVIMQSLNMKGLSEKLGLSSVTIKSGANKDMLNPFEEVNPEHIAMLQQMIDSMQDRFASIVQQSRGFESRELLDGRVFTASDALDKKFIDAIGYWQDAIDQTEALLGVDEVYMVKYSRKRGFFDALMSSKLPEISQLTSIQSPRFLYLWQP